MDTPVRLGTTDLLTVGEVAAQLRVSDETVRRQIRAGRLRAHAHGATYRIRTEDLASYLRGASTTAPTMPSRPSDARGPA